MITEHDLAEAIAECEGQRNPTANTCLKLAAFYIIRDKMFHVEHEPKFIPTYSNKSAEVKMEKEKAEHTDDSEFRQAIKDFEKDEIINIMDDVMNTLQIISPKLYGAVMRKIKIEF